jgi:hypothetical protein
MASAFCALRSSLGSPWPCHVSCCASLLMKEAKLKLGRPNKLCDVSNQRSSNIECQGVSEHHNSVHKNQQSTVCCACLVCAVKHRGKQLNQQL